MAVLAWAVLALALLSPMLAFISTTEPSFGAETGSNGTVAGGAHRTRAATTSAIPRRRGPVGPRTTRRTIALHWPRVAGADFYNLILVRNGKRRDLWPKTNSFTYVVTPAKASRGSDTLRWYVFAGRRVDGVVRFGKVHAQGQVPLRVKG